MQELLLAVARGLVEDKEAVKVTVDEPREDGTIVYHLSVAEGDMGRVIGKQQSGCWKDGKGRLCVFLIGKRSLAYKRGAERVFD